MQTHFHFNTGLWRTLSHLDAFIGCFLSTSNTLSPSVTSLTYYHAQGLRSDITFLNTMFNARPSILLFTA